MYQSAGQENNYPYPLLKQNPTPKEEEIYHYYYGTPPGYIDALAQYETEEKEAEEDERTKRVAFSTTNSMRPISPSDRVVERSSKNNNKNQEKELAALTILGVAGLAGLTLLHHHGNRYDPDPKSRSNLRAGDVGEGSERSSRRSRSKSGSRRGRRSATPHSGVGRRAKPTDGSQTPELDQSSGTDSDSGSVSIVSSCTPSLRTSRQRARRLRRRKFYHVGFATLATINAIDTICTSMKQRKARLEAIERGEVASKEADRKIRRGRWQDITGVGIAALGVQGAWEDFKEAKELKGEEKEWARRAEDKKRHRNNSESRRENVPSDREAWSRGSHSPRY